ncbi:MAG: DEAD/DEAH box helicase [Gammaproteobacteria bacterium]
MQNFQELKLPAPLEKALKKMQFTIPTPIQAQAIPIALTERDVIGCAQTGTGKTAAFCIPLIARLLELPNKIGLILIPTRELATQIADVLKKLTSASPELKQALLIGGASMDRQMNMLRNRPRIIIATPGRLMDHLARKTVSLDNIAVVVLDEADRMLDMGFAPQLNKIFQAVPRERQTLLFSATLPGDIEKMAAKWLNKPARVTVGKVAQTAAKISHSVVQTTVANKNNTLLDELNNRQGSILIFARTRYRTDRLAKYLSGFGHPVTHIHGDRTQGQRNSAIKGFRSGEFRILVATDIAARGLDISHIAHVINYDLPQVAEDYIHRIGRTGRAGAEGQALCLLTPEDRQQWRSIARVLEAK